MQIKSLDMSQTRILNIKILYFESTVLANFIEKPFLFFTCTLIENHHSLFWLWYKKSLRIYCATWRDNFHGPHLKFISYQRDFWSITSIYIHVSKGNDKRWSSFLVWTPGFKKVYFQSVLVKVCEWRFCHVIIDCSVLSRH